MSTPDSAAGATSRLSYAEGMALGLREVLEEDDRVRLMGQYFFGLTEHRRLTVAIRERFGDVRILFIPARCTSVMQPLDIGFNGPLKSRISKLCNEYIATQVCRDGVVDLKMETLKPALVRWLGKAIEELSARSEIHEQGWRPYTLGGESLGAMRIRETRAPS